MVVSITFYGALAKITGVKTTSVEALTLKEAIDKLIAQYGDSLKSRFFDAHGKLTRFVNIYVNGKDIRYLKQLDTQLSEKDSVSFIPAVGGG